MSAIVNPIEIELIQKLSTAIAQDRLELPSQPEILLALRKLRNGTDIEPAQLVATLCRDIALAARIVQVANSAAKRRGRTVESLDGAVARLGTELSLNLAMSFAVGQLFQARSALVDQRLRQAWRRGQQVATLSHALAARCTLLNPEMAMLAGLLHGIGQLPILKIADTEARIAGNAAALDTLVDALHPVAGCHLLRAWNFPAAACGIPTQCLDWEREHDGPADYADVVTIALLQDAAGRPAPRQNVEITEIPALRKLGLDAPTDIAAILDLDDATAASARV